MPHIPYGKPPRGSTAWAAERIARILEREEQEAGERGGRARRRNAREDFDAGARQGRPQATADPDYGETALPRIALPNQGLLAIYPTPQDRASNDDLLHPAFAPALPWVIPQIPAWVWSLGPLLGLAPMLHGDTPESDREFCHQRRDEELDRCTRWPQGWPQHSCKKRAWERFRSCYRNGGRPNPEEPPEWSEEDMRYQGEL